MNTTSTRFDRAFIPNVISYFSFILYLEKTKKAVIKRFEQNDTKFVSIIRANSLRHSQSGGREVK